MGSVWAITRENFVTINKQIILLSSHNNWCVDIHRVQLYPQRAPSYSVYWQAKYRKSTLAAWNAWSFELFKDSWQRHHWGPPLNVAFWCFALWAHTERLFCEVQEIRDGEGWMCDGEIEQRFSFRFVSGHLLGPPNRATHGRSKHAINALFCWGFI